MKSLKLFVTLFTLMLMCSAFTMTDKGKGLYIIGISASFSDSLIYFTDIQYVDGIMLDKDGFLPGRDLYSDQLDNYLEQQQGMKNRTCFVYFSEKKNKLEKNIKKMKAKYQKEGKSILRETGEEFKFVPVTE